MRTLKTWEMIRELSKNPKKKFKRKTDGLEIRNMCGRFNWEPGYTFLGVNDEWEEVQKPVNFMEVIRNDKGNVLVVHNYIDGIKNIEDVDDSLMAHTLRRLQNGKYTDFANIMYTLGFIFGTYQLKEIIKNGQWYIQD